MNKKIIDKKEILKCSIIIVIFLAINIIFRDIIGRDYDDFLVKWIDKIIENGRINSLSIQIGNYTPPYTYFLIIGTYITTNYVFWIKFVSNIFTIGIVVVVYFILRKFNKDIKFSNALLLLLIPGVFLNSSIVGQCDAIYTFFVLLFVCLMLNNKKKSSIFFYGVALAFKLQTLFIAPIFLYLLLKKKIKIIDLIYLPIGFFVAMLPSIIYGRSIIDIIKVLLSQSKGYLEIVRSAPNIYSQFHLNYVKVSGEVKIFLTIITILLTVFVVLKNTKNKDYSNKTFLEKVMLLSFVVPYFLPSMHDRYFYMANILVYIFFIFIDNSKDIRKFQIVNVILISIASALPVFLFNFVYVIIPEYDMLVEWLGVTVISSTMMTYLILVCFGRYLSNNNVSKNLC